MESSGIEKLAEELIGIVEKYEGLGAQEAELMKADFVRAILDALEARS
jgi:hypothetical protein